MSVSEFCPCCSKKTYANCCLPIITGKSIAITAVQLMQSRYSAYAIKDAQYIFDTYTKGSQKSQSVIEIKAWADECTWVELVIDASSSENNAEASIERNNILNKVATASVSFSAFYLNDNKYYKLSEKSHFIKEQISGESLWRYLDGNITEHSELKQINRNDVCPCFKNKQISKKKKFKRCCAN